MKKAKLWTIGLLILFILIHIWGCTPGNTGDETGMQTTGESLPKSTNSAIVPTASPQAASEDYFFLCGKYDLDFHLNTAFNSIIIPVVSRMPIDASAAKITLPLDKIEYQVFFNEVTLTEDNMQFFDYYLYQCYRGLDWGKVAQLFEAARNASAKLEDAGEPNRATQQQIVDEYWAYADQYSQDYDALTQEMLPQFYAYEVIINFYYDYDNPQDDAFSYMDVSWPGVDFRVECGEVRFHKENAFNENLDEIGGLNQVTGGIRDTFSSPYGSGSTTMLTGNFKTEDDITLTRGYFYGNAAEITQIQVYAASEEQNADSTPVHSMDYLWDGQTPLPVEGGLTVSLRTTFYDPRLQDMVPEGKLYFFLEYEYQGKHGVSVTELGLHRNANFYELAAIYLDGIDVRSYYEEFYYPCLQEKPNKSHPDPA